MAKWSVEQRANMIMKSRTKVRLELWATRMAVLKTYNTKVMGFEQLTGELPGDSSSTAAEYAAHSCLLVVVVVLVPCPSTAWSGAAAVSQQSLGVEQVVMAAAAAASPSKGSLGCRFESITLEQM